MVYGHMVALLKISFNSDCVNTTFTLTLFFIVVGLLVVSIMAASAVALSASKLNRTFFFFLWHSSLLSTTLSCSVGVTKGFVSSSLFCTWDSPDVIIGFKQFPILDRRWEMEVDEVGGQSL